jgi:hypothetical protein
VYINHFHAQLRTTSNYSVTAHLHSSEFTTAHTKPFPACCVFTSRSLAAASNSGGFSASRAQVLLSTVNSGTLNPILSCKCQLSRHHLFSIIISIIFDCRFSTDSRSSSVLVELNYTAILQLTQLSTQLVWGHHYAASGRTRKKTSFSNNPSIASCVISAAGRVYRAAA